MDRSYASQAQAVCRATLLGLAILSMVTWVPHVYYCVKTFFLVSLPSAASTLATPKCLFVFSNIIVIFLANESKLSERQSFTDNESPSSDLGADAAAIRYHVAAVTKQLENDVTVNHVPEGSISEEQESRSVAVADESLQHLDQGEQVDDSSTMLVVATEFRQDNVDNISVDIVDDEMEKQESLVLQEELIKEEASEEEEEFTKLPTDELNRRVEEFIARFNMERQLEARMLVCCY